ncbi:hypothetical protein AYO44_09355 [Planctomycetaceae bacterium SCGC AG-212-F19]|nr:hypothetical protein AYO44_09355 [Planctomycetaceae bacterium SCGC AG-212-F19]
MRYVKLILVGILAGVLLPSLRAQVTLAPKFPDKFYVELKTDHQRSGKTTKGETKDHTETSLVLGVAVLKTNADGGLVAELKIESYKGSVTDAAGKRTESAVSQLQGTTVQVTLDAGMNVTKVDGLAALIAKFDPQGKASALAKANTTDHYEMMFRDWASQIFVPLGGKAVNTGDKWEQKSVRRFAPYGSFRLTKTLVYGGTETIDGKELHRLTFTTAHAFNPTKAAEAAPLKVTRLSINKGVYEGTLYFDAAAGRLLRADCKEQRDLVMTLSGDVRDSEVRIRDEGTSSMRFHEKNPLP